LFKALSADVLWAITFRDGAGAALSPFRCKKRPDPHSEQVPLPLHPHHPLAFGEEDEAGVKKRRKRF